MSHCDMKKEKMLISACLLEGGPWRYDGKTKCISNPKIKALLDKLLEEERLIPFCPEVAGGLGIPRPPAEIQGEGETQERAEIQGCCEPKVEGEPQERSETQGETETVGNEQTGVSREERRTPWRRVVNSQGMDVTAEYVAGAKEALGIARKEGIRIAILKEKSPSCGKNFIYDGSFTGTLIPGEGITAELLRRAGLRIFNEKEVEEAVASLEEDR